MPTARLRFRTSNFHDSLGRALRFIRVAEIGVVRVHVQRLEDDHVVDISIFADAIAALQIVVRRLECVIGVMDLDVQMDHPDPVNVRLDH
jgi:hypothetical protein